ncbi:MAG: hypothetical protein IJ863_07555 [Spirochaetales bacterium]|nr:hypothetical protein [Spirochaetales bacterium]
MKRTATILLLLAVCFSAFAAQSLVQMLPTFSESQMQKILSDTTIEALTTEGQSLAAIAPAGSQGAKLAAQADAMDGGFAVAGLSFIPYPESYSKMSEQERRVAVYNVIRSISTQKGITYISHMAGDKPTVLFEDSYLLSDPDKMDSRIPDPVASEVPSAFSCYAYQKDNRFGKNVYKVTYDIQESDFLMRITNHTKMKYMGVSCVDREGLNMYLEIIAADEGFILYTMAVVQDRKPQVKVLFITVDLPSAFMRRTTALKEWFEMRVKQ